MHRFLLEELLTWKNAAKRKPIVISGARQVGKSHLIERLLAPHFTSVIVINFEETPGYADCFEPDLKAESICTRLELVTQTRIIPGETLLFFDESQACERCLLALRYFYEALPELHVIAAGSLLEFTLQKLSIPVGRVIFRHLTPLNFQEFLYNSGNEPFLSMLQAHDCTKPLEKALHQKGITLLKNYLLTGGMPEIVAQYLENGDMLQLAGAQRDLLEAYRRDFPRYTRKTNQYECVDVVFRKAPYYTCKQFKFTQISRELKSTKLRDAIDLLEMACVLTRVHSATMLPASTHYRLDRYKLLFLDVGLLQSAINFDKRQWLNAEDSLALVGHGMIAEQFVGQELLAGAQFRKPLLTYWERTSAQSSAEVDYLLEKDGSTIPIEVKSGKVGTLKSLRRLFEEASSVQQAVRVSSNNFEVSADGKVLSIPAYAFGVWLKNPG